MTTSIKKLLLIFITSLLGVMSGGVMALDVIATNDNVLIDGTYFNFAAITNSYDSQRALYQSQPWWGDATKAQTFASAAGGGSLADADFIYSVNGFGTGYYSYYNLAGNLSSYEGSTSDPILPWGAAIVTSSSGGAPEIDGALAPQVGFLLGCLFLMFGRKKQQTEPILPA